MIERQSLEAADRANREWARKRATSSLIVAISAWVAVAVSLILPSRGSWVFLGSLAGFVASLVAISQGREAREVYALLRVPAAATGKRRAVAGLAVAWSFVALVLLATVWLIVGIIAFAVGKG